MNSGELTGAKLTHLLQAWSGGDSSALEQLAPIVYAELRRLARRNMVGEREGHLLQPSALVNEAFVRLMDAAPIGFENRTHFFAIAARVMRQILIDVARAQATTKRGQKSPHLELAEVKDVAGEITPLEFVDLDSALNQLAALDARQAQVVELRYFGGLENREIAAVLGVSEPTVVRDWRIARAWLYNRLRSASSAAAP